MSLLKNIFSLALFSGLLASCGSKELPLEVVQEVNLRLYSGLWYEIAAFPQSFQKGCSCTTADYLPMNDYIRVVNKCWKAEKNKWAVSEGKAFIVPETNNAKLEVQFFWPFRGKYWIIQLANDYSYAVIGHPNRDYLWILGRQPQIPELIYDDILRTVSAQGFDVSRLVRTQHTDCPEK